MPGTMMMKRPMMKKVVKVMALKKVKPNQKGLKKLPRKVRNKMGYPKHLVEKSKTNSNGLNFVLEVKSAAKRKFKVYPSAYANACMHLKFVLVKLKITPGGKRKRKKGMDGGMMVVE